VFPRYQCYRASVAEYYFVSAVSKTYVEEQGTKDFSHVGFGHIGSHRSLADL